MRAWALSLVFAAAAVAQPANYFPLAVGNRWEYAAGREKNHRVIEVLDSTRFDGKIWFRVHWMNSNEVFLRLDESGRLVTREDDRKEQVWIDFAAGEKVAFERSIAPCNHNGFRAPAKLAQEIQIVYLSVCSDLGLESDWFREKVGLTERVESSIAGSLVWRLVSARINGQEQTF